MLESILPRLKDYFLYSDIHNFWFIKALTHVHSHPEVEIDWSKKII